MLQNTKTLWEWQDGIFHIGSMDTKNYNCIQIRSKNEPLEQNQLCIECSRDGSFRYVAWERSTVPILQKVGSIAFFTKFRFQFLPVRQ
jgi:hypothetical protein